MSSELIPAFLDRQTIIQSSKMMFTVYEIQKKFVIDWKADLLKSMVLTK